MIPEEDGGDGPPAKEDEVEVPRFLDSVPAGRLQGQRRRDSRDGV